MADVEDVQRGRGASGAPGMPVGVAPARESPLRSSHHVHPAGRPGAGLPHPPAIRPMIGSTAPTGG